MVMNIQFGSAPREGSEAARPGSYVPAVRLTQSRVDPGAMVEGDVFITGYGQIGFAKLAFYPSLGLINPLTSVVKFGYEKRDEVIFFGGQEAKCGDDGFIISLVGGVQVDGWAAPSMFFDLKKNALPQIATETRQVRAPVSFVLQLRKDVRPGDYPLQFIMTYFNGESWCTATAIATVSVRNILQRWEIQAGLLAVAAALAAIVQVFL